ncbi:MAG: hypothetical protein IT557_04935 [Alphaproteobacteria bacterium]|nr:hypothetical protein [Alphaproteobacteria bacterium]
MGRVNEPGGHIVEFANAHAGTAELHWLPIPRTLRARFRSASSYAVPLQESYLALKIEASTWDHAGKPPFSWIAVEQPEPQTHPRPISSIWFSLDQVHRAAEKRGYVAPPYENVGVVLYVFVAPHVAVIRPEGPDLAEIGLTIRIIRVASWSAVPAPGSQANIGQHVGVFPMADFVACHELHAQSIAQCTASFSGLELELRHSSGGYGIKVVLDELRPCLAHITFEPRPGGYHAFHVGATEAVEVSAWQGDNRLGVPLFAPELLVYRYAIEHESRNPDRYVGSLIGISNLPFEPCATAAGPPQPLPKGAAPPPWDTVRSCDSLEGWVPPPIWTVTGRRTGGVTVDRLKMILGSPAVDWIPTIVDTAIGLVPYLGTAYDLATMAKIAASGSDFWGEPKTEGDIALMAAFLALGSFGDIAKGGAKASAEILPRLQNVADALYPGFRVVSTNPGLSQVFLRTVFSAIDPAMMKAAERVLDAEAAMKYAARLDEAARLLKQGGNPDAAIRLFKDIIGEIEAELRVLAEIPVGRIETHPAFAAASGRILVDDIPGFAALDAEPAEKIRGILREAVRNGDFEGMVDQIRQIDGDIAAKWVDSTQAAMIEEVVSHPRVQRGYANHVANGGKSSILDYALKASRGGLRDMLYLRFGRGGFDFMLGRRRLEPATIEQILDRPGAIEEVRKLINRLDSYESLRDSIRALKDSHPGLGTILEADHLIEKRIRIRSEDWMLDEHAYLSMLQPADEQVAAALRARGIDTFHYVHTAKTRRMDELIPQGEEVSMSLQSIADAYQSFWLKEVGVTHETFLGLFQADFARLADEAGEAAPSLAPKSGQELLRSIAQRRLAMNGRKLFLSKVKGRATQAIDTP